MKSLPFALLFLFVSATLPLWADAKADALKKLAQVSNPPMVITQDQASGSPYVQLTDKGAIINKAATTVPYDQVLTALAALPDSAWPYGRVIFYSAGNAAPADAAKVEADLAKANVRALNSPPR